MQGEEKVETDLLFVVVVVVVVVLLSAFIKPKAGFWMERKMTFFLPKIRFSISIKCIVRVQKTFILNI